MKRNDEFILSSHILKINSYLKPTRCDYCSAFLIGLVRQGLRCRICKQNFHKLCCMDPGNSCDQSKARANSTAQLPLSPTTTLSRSNTNIPEIEHTFFLRTLYQKRKLKLTCKVCDEVINDESYKRCKDCKLKIHVKCEDKCEKNCHATHETQNSSSDEQDDDYGKDELVDVTRRMRFVKNPSKKIQAQRVSISIKRNQDGYFWKGFIYYSTSESTQFYTHHWRLDDKRIQIYTSSSTTEKLNEISLQEIEQIVNCDTIPYRNSKIKLERECLFYFKIKSTITYFCGMNTDPTNSWNCVAKNFFNIFKMAHLPFVRNNRSSIKISAPKYEEKCIDEDFHCNANELLGAGQFGQVYSGFNKSNQAPVAIKIIDKSRFKDSKITDINTFQTEVAILYNLHHHGIVKLFALYDEPNNLFIVTERMAADMLEMILSKDSGKLSERVAKFCLRQILTALNFLHKRNIAHCDLKPENVLLCEQTEFPQLKICDFGYARIIDENSFRRSLVGTPAYSPPEVKQRKVFNKSMDMWSMGVITYVSLSGVFPFDEDRDIHEQIQNSNFMFPDDPWKEISHDAVDLINTEFLQVSIDKRASASRALRHQWFNNDSQLYFDLVNLEKKIGDRWLTSTEEEIKWQVSTDL